MFRIGAAKQMENELIFNNKIFISVYMQMMNMNNQKYWFGVTIVYN